jgi:hypothetical protein
MISNTNQGDRLTGFWMVLIVNATRTQKFATP